MTLLACLGRFSIPLKLFETSFSAFGSINKQIPECVLILRCAEGHGNVRNSLAKFPWKKDSNNYTHIRFMMTRIGKILN